MPFVVTPSLVCLAQTSLLEVVVPFNFSLELLGNAALACPLGLTIFYSMDTSTDVGDVLQGLPTATERDHSLIAARAPNRIPSANTSLPIGDYKM